MYVLGSQLKNLQIFSLQTGQPIAKVSGQILDPSTLDLTAFYLGGSKSAAKVLLTKDIRRLTPDTVVVDSEEDISDANDIVRLQELIEKPFQLPGVLVVTESGQKLGKVTDYTVGLSTRKVQKIYVKPPLVRSFLSSSLIIDRAQITDVTHSKITVRDANIAQPAMARGIRPVTD